MFCDDIMKGEHRGTRVGGRSEIWLRGFHEADKTWGSFPRRSRNTPCQRLLLLHVVGGHGAIKKRAVALMVGMVDVGLLGEVGSCC